MKNKNTVFFRAMVWAVCLLVLGAVLFCGAAYWKYRTLPEDMPVTVTEQYLSAGEVQLGQTFVLSVTFRVPWNRSPEQIQYTPAEGIQTAAVPDFVLDRYGWGASYWKVVLVLQTYRDGTLQPGNMQVQFSGKDGSFLFELPEIKVTAPEVDPAQPLALAGEYIPPEKETPLGAIIAAGSGLLILALVLFAMRDLFFRKKAPPELTAGEKALNSVQQLRQDVNEKRILPDAALPQLSDIVRHYIEQQFFIRAERQTTTEFLHELEKDNSPLEEKDRRFLSRFMASVDMVKYAKLHAESDMFDSAADRAENLIRGGGGEHVL